MRQKTLRCSKKLIVLASFYKFVCFFSGMARDCRWECGLLVTSRRARAKRSTSALLRSDDCLFGTS